YAFQHRRYWPGATAAPGDVRSAGLGAAGHPLLGAAVAFPDGAGALLTGRLSASAQPWLADHTVAGTVVLPGTALLELAVRAGDEVGCTGVEELTLATPLTLPTAGGAVTVQVRAGADDGSGRRPVTVHARPEGSDEWTEHATGTLTTLAPGPVRFDATTWPPTGAAELDVEGCYERFAEAGFGYGPVFRGLTGAWRDGDTVYAEVSLPDPDTTAEDAARFGLHPALLDAALHAALLTGDGAAGLPWAWEDVTLHAAGATALRVRLAPATDGGGLAVAVADPEGR
ncbi:polyketide synthase dehydratase domain-containing protein, partial [Pseudonocardia sp. SID8383]